MKAGDPRLQWYTSLERSYDTSAYTCAFYLKGIFAYSFVPDDEDKHILRLKVWSTVAVMRVRRSWLPTCHHCDVRHIRTHVCLCRQKEKRERGKEREGEKIGDGDNRVTVTVQHPMDLDAVHRAKKLHLNIARCSCSWGPNILTMSGVMLSNLSVDITPFNAEEDYWSTMMTFDGDMRIIWWSCPGAILVWDIPLVRYDTCDVRWVIV